MTYVQESYGKAVSAEFVKEKLVKDFLIKRFYILRFEQSYLQFYFILYNNNFGWTITNFGYDQEIDDLF